MRQESWVETGNLRARGSTMNGGRAYMKFARICVPVLKIGHHHAPVKIRAVARIDALPGTARSRRGIVQLIGPTGDYAGAAAHA